jgi:hypothetical protein
MCFKHKGEDKIFQWGDVNGEWNTRELNDDTKLLFSHLNYFPDTFGKPITISSDQITMDMYDALKKGHTPAHFDLDEYIRVTDAFIKKWPVYVPGLSSAQLQESYTDGAKIGHIQKKFPAWIAAIWCSTIQFKTLPDFKHIIAAANVCRLKLDYRKDFFDNSLGKSEYVGKTSYGGRPECGTAALCSGWGDGLAFDLAAMAALCNVITDELGKFKKLLPEESKSTPRLDG